jgi:hypothetical protein
MWHIEQVRMKMISILFAVAALFVCAGAFSVKAQEFDYSEYDRLTRKYVDDRGLVDYKGLKGELGALARTAIRSDSKIAASSCATG